MVFRRAKNNRKPLVIARAEANTSTIYHKDEIIHQFDVNFRSNLHHYIEKERVKLKSLDKTLAKRVISNAENNLLHFLRSRAKINCLRTQENVHPFNIVTQDKKIQKHQLFDDKKLQHEIEREQKYKKVKQIEYSPLFERCLRQTVDLNSNRITQSRDKKQPSKKQNKYIPLSLKHRQKKNIF